MPELVLSLFPGIGLLDHAFEAEGFTVVRGPDPLWGGDIRGWRVPAGRFDGVIGGPPCQTFSSLARLVRANGHEPKFGNLIPEFERVATEAQPAWFLMENVPQAPEPSIEGYGAKSFLLCNSWIAAGDGFGQEQRRVRRFTFGLRGCNEAPSLKRWIDLAVFLLPDATRAVTMLGPDHLAGLAKSTTETRKKQREATVTAMHDSTENLNEWSRTRKVAVTSTDGGVRPSERRKAVSSSNGGNGSQRNTPGAGNAGKGRYRLPDACRLQGLPEDFLSDAPFTAEGKLKAVANVVPLPMGRAVARAVKEALADDKEGQRASASE